jgi:hypothetical protein
MFAVVEGMAPAALDGRRVRVRDVREFLAARAGGSA